MRPLTLICCFMLMISLQAQTTGVPGVSDFTLNGVGSGQTSPVSLTVLTGFNNLEFSVSAQPGSTIVGVVGSSAPAAIPVGTFFLDVLPFTIWLDPASLPGFPASFTTVPPSGVWTMSLSANVLPGTMATFQFGVLNPSFAGNVGLTQAITLQESPNLPHCLISFDGLCPNLTPSCGATFVGGTGCFSVGLLGCYASGLSSYGVTPVAPLTISLAGDLNTLNVFFANQDSLSAGSMAFLDAANNPVLVTDGLGNPQPNPTAAQGACSLLMPPALNLVFASPVRSIQVLSTAGSVWIDNFEINP